ncbi:MAG: nucleoside-diphosphate kinase [Clostridia bacterium]|nr:nucleoside-diphosphate kinase [Clostridia bacterium]
MEKTFIILKPDAVERKLVGEIISRLERKNLNLLHMKVETIPKDIAQKHYEHVKDIPIFGEMIEYITSGPVVMMIVQGEQAINTVRTMMGKTSSFEALPGTIRGDYGAHRYKNLIHASDSPESAAVEIQRFFPEIKDE